MFVLFYSADVSYISLAGLSKTSEADEMKFVRVLYVLIINNHQT